MPASEASPFIPPDLSASDFSKLEPFYQSLIDLPINSPAELESWLADVNDLAVAVDEYATRKYVDKSCHTDDKEIERAFLHYIEEVEPRIKPLFFKLQQKFVASPHRAALAGGKDFSGKGIAAARYSMLQKRWGTDVELFREENVPLEAQCAKLNNEFDKLSGEMTVLHQGKEQTLPQMAKYLEMPDRATRQWAWELSANRRLVDRERIELIFDQLRERRNQIAKNAGLSDYRAWCWKAYKRFDYTPDDCLRFADAIEEICVPMVRKLDEQRRKELGLEALRPWDLAVDPQNRAPLRPYEESEPEALIFKTHGIFSRLSPPLADWFDSLRQKGHLDLASRKGKAPGGYQTTFEKSGDPFIFMNAAGLQRDVDVLLHEAGHAFHTIAARPEPLLALRSPPMEFAEVASMSMELLGADHYELFYADPASVIRARRMQLEGIVRFFPWMTTIDSFQHWIYTNPRHTAAERKEQWISLTRRFGREVDWSGYEPARDWAWQGQLHLFHYPFYYIEYGIAQLGALQLWLKSRTDMRTALSNYRAALALGGSRPLPELFAAAGLSFDLSKRTLGPLMKAVGEELAELE